ncbi:MAG: CapA family protein [Bacteroidia bacterium]|nr:CapA family protein [Bacteroidia bacterium]
MNEEASILITGDYCPINRIEELSDKNQVELIFNDLLPFIQKADLSITNFESPATQTNKPIAKYGPVLKVQSSALKILKSAGFDLVTLANNHILDYGEEGLKNTIDSCAVYSIEYTGAGNNNLEARRIFYKLIKGVKIAILNIAENEFGTTANDSYGAAPLDPIQNYYDIQKAKQSADYIFVIIHGGHEMYCRCCNRPSYSLC